MQGNEPLLALKTALDFGGIAVYFEVADAGQPLNVFASLPL